MALHIITMKMYIYRHHSSLCIFEGPVISVIMHKIGTWRTQMIAAMLLIGSSIATSFATQYWHVIISYAITEGRGEAQ